MSQRKAVTLKKAAAYRKASKAGKDQILDEQGNPRVSVTYGRSLRVAQEVLHLSMKETCVGGERDGGWTWPLNEVLHLSMKETRRGRCWRG